MAAWETAGTEVPTGANLHNGINEPNSAAGKHEGKFLSGYASDCGKQHASFVAAVQACLADPQAGGITQEESCYTVRMGTALVPSPSGESSWLKQALLASQDSSGEGSSGECTGVVSDPPSMLTATTGKPFDARVEPCNQFVLLGRLTDNSTARSPHEHPCSPLGGGTIKQMASACIGLGCVGFDTTGRVFARIDRTQLVPGSKGPYVYGLADGPPWHHVDVVFAGLEHTGCYTELRSLSTDVEFLGNVPQDVNWYLCFFGGWTTWGGFYGGLQTNVGCPESDHQNETAADYGCIFSRWGPASWEDIRVDGESFGEAADYEGDFCSVRRHLNWGTGKYTLRFDVAEPDAVGVWVSYTVVSHATSASTVIGWLRFRRSLDGQEFALKPDSTIYNFLEIYGSERVYAESITSSTIVVNNLKINDTPVLEEHFKAHASYFKYLPRYAKVDRLPDRTDPHLAYHLGANVDQLEPIITHL